MCSSRLSQLATSQFPRVILHPTDSLLMDSQYTGSQLTGSLEHTASQLHTVSLPLEASLTDNLLSRKLQSVQTWATRLL